MSEEFAESPDTPLHPIGVVAARTGLSIPVLRAWERRYGVVEPGRSAGGQRLYSDADIERLILLRRATDLGRPISHAARLDSAALRSLIEQDELARAKLQRDGADPTRGPASGDAPHAHLQRAVAAVDAMDQAGLESVLTHANFALGAAAFLEHVVEPLLDDIGRRWSEGAVRPAHEHVASVAVRRVLTWLLQSARPAPGAPRLVFATPTGESHEFGALLAAATAATEGFAVTHLGADLPAVDIALAAQTLRADIVGLSVVLPTDTARLACEISELRDRLPSHITIVAGGRGLIAHDAALASLPIVRFTDLATFRGFLRTRI